MNRDGSGEITTRNEIARTIIAGFAAVTPMLAGAWRLVDAALADLPTVLVELEGVRGALEEARLDRAILLAAIRAAVGAWADGEDDPLWYLRDELGARQMPSQRHRRPM